MVPSFLKVLFVYSDAILYILELIQMYDAFVTCISYLAGARARECACEIPSCPIFDPVCL